MVTDKPTPERPYSPMMRIGKIGLTQRNRLTFEIIEPSPSGDFSGHLTAGEVINYAANRYLCRSGKSPPNGRVLWDFGVASLAPVEIEKGPIR